MGETLDGLTKYPLSITVEMYMPVHHNLASWCRSKRSGLFTPTRRPTSSAAGGSDGGGRCR